MESNYTSRTKNEPTVYMSLTNYVSPWSSSFHCSTEKLLMQKTLYYSFIQTAVCYNVTNKCTHFITITMMWTHSNLKAAPITVHISTSILIHWWTCNNSTYW